MPCSTQPKKFSYLMNLGFISGLKPNDILKQLSPICGLEMVPLDGRLEAHQPLERKDIVLIRSRIPPILSLSLFVAKFLF